MTDRDDIYYRAVLARDNRFDGKFFVGVKTTGIYCRPICPARPKRENVTFFATALAAEKAGYRPCLRCRPESAPRSPAWIGTSAVVRRALRMISAQPQCHLDEDTFAEQFGLSARHLRRLFDDEVGQTPKRIADSIRLDFARKLIVETQLPITEIALASGFRSLRRFNSAMKDRFRRPPSEIRKHQNERRHQRRPAGTDMPIASATPGILLTLAYRPPLDWDALLQFYRTHGIPGIESVSANSYTRTFQIDGATGMFEATNESDRSRIRLRIITDDTRCLFQVAQRVRLMFDLDADPVIIANAFARCPILSRLVQRHPGLRIARGWDPFETAVGTILGQLVSTLHARQLAGQMAREYGAPFRTTHPRTTSGHSLNDADWYHFPIPQRLAAARLSRVGTTRTKKQAIRAFSQLVAQGDLSFAAEQDLTEFRERLLQIHGIGPWTAEYIALRAMGDTDAFPADDLVLRQMVRQNPEMDLDSVRPWRGYAAIHLWHEFAGSVGRRAGKSRTKE